MLPLMKNWLVVSIPLKNMLVKMGSSSPIFGVKINNIWVATTYKNHSTFSTLQFLPPSMFWGSILPFQPATRDHQSTTTTSSPYLWSFHARNTKEMTCWNFETTCFSWRYQDLPVSFGNFGSTPGRIFPTFFGMEKKSRGIKGIFTGAGLVFMVN